MKNTTAIIDEIRKERERQVTDEGFLTENDDKYAQLQLIKATIAYCVSATDDRLSAMCWWPWHEGTFKPTTPRRDLIKAAALLVAEIERLDRRDEVQPISNQTPRKSEVNVATHVLKTLPKFFDRVAEGTKTAELRKNDRGFKVGDYVKLIRSDGSSKPASITRRISHIVEGGQYGLAQDFCMLSLADIAEVQS